MNVLNLRFPLAGLDPATHVFAFSKRKWRQDVDARVTPGQGALYGVAAA
jgi:hypothetical protein